VVPTRAFALTAAVLVAFNVARGLGAFGDWDDLAAIGLTGVLVLVAVIARVGPDVLGLERADVRRGLAYGGVAVGLVVVVVGVTAALPATSSFLDDARVDVSFAAMVHEVLVGIVLATVVPEELAFRGLLLGTGAEAWGRWRGALASSALFGLWHISPTLSTSGDNARLADASTGAGGDVGLVVGAVALTFVAGLVFSWMRLRSRSLVAPMLAHAATNAVAFTVAWALAR
jgi:membrane protease YdiL (CAAX protease family)